MNSPVSASRISTPCVQVCVVDPLSTTCIGCGRTTAEIAAWPAMSEPERLAVMATLDQRQTKSRSRAERGGRVRRAGTP
jgi:uncharacterized protein